jgi:hypothetical protein
MRFSVATSWMRQRRGTARVRDVLRLSLRIGTPALAISFGSIGALLSAIADTLPGWLRGAADLNPNALPVGSQIQCDPTPEAVRVLRAALDFCKCEPPHTDRSCRKLFY